MSLTLETFTQAYKIISLFKNYFDKAACKRIYKKDWEHMWEYWLRTGNTDISYFIECSGIYQNNVLEWAEQLYETHNLQLNMHSMKI
jgi:hypothetical protein